MKLILKIYIYLYTSRYLKSTYDNVVEEFFQQVEQNGLQNMQMLAK